MMPPAPAARDSLPAIAHPRAPSADRRRASRDRATSTASRPRRFADKNRGRVARWESDDGALTTGSSTYRGSSAATPAPPGSPDRSAPTRSARSRLGDCFLDEGAEIVGVERIQFPTAVAEISDEPLVPWVLPLVGCGERRQVVCLLPRQRDALQSDVIAAILGEPIREDRAPTCRARSDRNRRRTRRSDRDRHHPRQHRGSWSRR